jgi:3-hydroxyisobutyrate dehydrogenase-like beta-hydroxyacid dehydrogenase
VALVGAGHMGSGLGWALREGGARVVTTLAGRSARTARLVASAGLECLKDLDHVVRTATHILVVTPPGEAITAAASIAAAARRTGSSPLVVDLNALAPATATAVAEALEPLDFVDGSISGSPPTVRAGARIFFSGPRAAEFVALPWRHVVPINVGPVVGAASAVKMSTASVYKGLVGLYAQAIRSADHYDVLATVLDDLRSSGYDMVRDVAVAATKAHRYVPEMREISIAQAQAGLTPELFAAFAEVYAQMATTPLADDDPESVGDVTAAEVVRRLRFTD